MSFQFSLRPSVDTNFRYKFSSFLCENSRVDSVVIESCEDAKPQIKIDRYQDIVKI